MTYTIEHKPTRNTSPRSKYGGSKRPKYICLHHWGADGQAHNNVVYWLRGADGKNRSSSAHEVISAGRVTVLAPAGRATWHSGTNKGNGEDYALECRPEMSDGDWETLVERCADLEEQHGSFHYRKHSDHKSTACPGRYSDRLGELVQAVNAAHKRRRNGEKSKPSKPATSVPAFPLPAGHWFGTESSDKRNHSGYWPADRPHIRRYQQRMKERGWKIGVTGRFDQQTRDVTVQFQRGKRLRVDGAAGRETWDAAWSAPIT